MLVSRDEQVLMQKLVDHRLHKAVRKHLDSAL